MTFQKSERAATACIAVNGPRKFAHAGKRRDFIATKSLPTFHSGVELEEASLVVDAWEPLGAVLQRFLTKLEARRHG